MRRDHLMKLDNKSPSRLLMSAKALKLKKLTGGDILGFYDVVNDTFYIAFAYKGRGKIVRIPGY